MYIYIYIYTYDNNNNNNGNNNNNDNNIIQYNIILGNMSIYYGPSEGDAQIA